MYAATKGALEAFSIGLSREWGSLGIRSNCVAPGFMETEMTSSLTDLQRERIYQRNSLREATSIASAAAAVCFLISDAATSITGQCLGVDAGTV
jgi:3-oxoacyl-[acyl-carrier protein] reductase